MKWDFDDVSNKEKLFQDFIKLKGLLIEYYKLMAL